MRQRTKSPGAKIVKDIKRATSNANLWQIELGTVRHLCGFAESRHRPRGALKTKWGWLFRHTVKSLFINGFVCNTGGDAGIRTLGTREGSTVFETAPFDHSGTSPRSVTGARLIRCPLRCKPILRCL